jgi:hypothetical protein
MVLKCTGRDCINLLLQKSLITAIIRRKLPDLIRRARRLCNQHCRSSPHFSTDRVQPLLDIFPKAYWRALVLKP